MAWSPPARQRRSWLAEQAGDYATSISHHTGAGTPLAVTAILLALLAAATIGLERLLD
jgi:hypothetical protein